MKLIAKQPCSFGGKRYFIGNEIPVEYVLNPETQERLGVIAIVSDDVLDSDGDDHDTIVIPAPALRIIVKTDDNEMELEPTDEGIQDVFSVIIGKTADAEAIINQMTDEDALILLHMADSRKSVKAAAEARALSLRESEGDQ